jgi:hypothetical protein
MRRRKQYEPACCSKEVQPRIVDNRQIIRRIAGALTLFEVTEIPIQSIQHPMPPQPQIPTSPLRAPASPTTEGRPIRVPVPLSGSRARAFSTRKPEKRQEQANPSNLCLNSAHSVIAGDHRNAHVNMRKKAKCL